MYEQDEINEDEVFKMLRKKDMMRSGNKKLRGKIMRKFGMTQN